jgi:hypothetical protein
MVSGSLTLTNRRLEWERSSGPILFEFVTETLAALRTDKGPGRVSVSADAVAVAPAGHIGPWRFWFGPGFLMWGPFESRDKIAVYVIDTRETLEFAVKDANGWLSDLMQAGARQGVFER